MADDHPIYRAGLRTALESEPDFNVVGEAGDFSQLLTLVEQLNPDVLLLDVMLGEENSLHFLDLLHEIGPQMQVIILTAFADKDILLSAIRAGIQGFVIKEAGRVEIATAIRCVYQNKAYLDPRVTKMVIKLINSLITSRDLEKAAGDEKQLQKSHTLTKREREIFCLVRRGLKNKEIATRLNISTHTVHNHLINIYRKLGVSHRRQLTLASIDQND
nr:response regulator transcription factor [Moorella sulfitireducens]